MKLEDMMTQLAWSEMLQKGQKPSGWTQSKSEVKDLLELVELEVRDRYTNDFIKKITVTRAYCAKLQFQGKINVDVITHVKFIEQ